MHLSGMSDLHFYSEFGLLSEWKNNDVDVCCSFLKHERVQLQYEQYYAKIEVKLPIFKQKWSDLIPILG